MRTPNFKIIILIMLIIGVSSPFIIKSISKTTSFATKSTKQASKMTSKAKDIYETIKDYIPI